MVRRSPLVTALVVVLLAAACATPGAPGSPSPSATAASPSASAASPTPSPTAAPPSPSPSPPPTTPSPTAAPPSASPSPAATMIVRAYFFLDDAAGGDPALVPVLRTVPETKAVATAAMTALLAGPSNRERTAEPAIRTTIPADSELLGIRISGGVATVNLSGEFEAGGGSFSVLGRLAQVVYTLTQFSSVDRVRFELDGEPVTLFSAEGIVLDEPVGRATYRDEFLPAIFVDRPAWGAALPYPGRVTGLANVFEAQFRIAVLDRAGRSLVDRQVLASCGTGCWGTFDVTLPYDVSTAQWGTLRVWDLSARDGSRVDVREYPVYLRPGD